MKQSILLTWIAALLFGSCSHKTTVNMENKEHYTFALSDKELLIISSASHVDLYDNKAGVIPYDKMEQFLNQHLK